MKSRGFTLLELLIVLAMCGIIGAIIYEASSKTKKGQYDEAQHAVPVKTEKAASCLNGIVHQNGQPLVKDGYAVRC